MKNSQAKRKRAYSRGETDFLQAMAPRPHEVPVQRTAKPLMPMWVFIALGFIMPIIIIVFFICPIAGSFLTIAGFKGMQEARFFGDKRQGQAQ